MADRKNNMVKGISRIRHLVIRLLRDLTVAKMFLNSRAQKTATISPSIRPAAYAGLTDHVPSSMGKLALTAYQGMRLACMKR